MSKCEDCGIRVHDFEGVCWDCDVVRCDIKRQQHEANMQAAREALNEVKSTGVAPNIELDAKCVVEACWEDLFRWGNPDLNAEYVQDSIYWLGCFALELGGENALREFNRLVDAKKEEKRV